MERDRILDLLEEAGTHVSGEQLSRGLGVSRSAVWKQIRSLRELGYRISGSPRSGYLYEGAPDLLLPREIRKHLQGGTFGREIIHLSTTASTNQTALELARQGYPEGTVVVAEEQTAGRGRWQRSWHSPAGCGIWLSLILRPPLAPVEVPQITLVVGASCARAIEAVTGLRPGIKWPNDLVWEGKKLCGILVEMEAATEQVKHLVAGIGINVNQEEEDFPPELRETAASLRMALGCRVERALLAGILLATLEQDYREFLCRGLDSSRETWLAYQITLGHRVRVQLRGRELTGEATGLDAGGNLILRLDDGTLQKVSSGEIILCRGVPAS